MTSLLGSPFGGLNGVWIGNESDHVLQCCLSFNLTTNQEGIVVGARQSLHDNVQFPLILHGTWSRQTWAFECTEAIPSAERAHFEDLHYTPRCYKGKITRTASSTTGELVPVIMGTVSPALSSDSPSSPFALYLETNDAHVVAAGYAVGLAKPADELKDFMVPTNPIQWSFAILPPNNNNLNNLNHPSNNNLFGGGFFDDSLDVSDHPSLHFALTGSWDPTTSRVLIRKCYESFPETDGVIVEYDGSFSPPEIPDFPSGSLHGSWRNTTHHTHGHWTARVQPPLPSETANILVTCERCGIAMRPGETRWHPVSQPLLPEFICPSCYVDLPDPDRYFPGIFSDVTTASGECTAQLVRHAFEKYADNPFFGVLLSKDYPPQDSPFPPPHRAPLIVGEDLRLQWYSYHEIHRCVAALASAVSAELSEPLTGKTVMFCGNSSPTSAIAQLMALLSGAVLVPLPATIDCEAATLIFRQTRPVLLFVSHDAAGCWQALTQLEGEVPRVVLQDCAIEAIIPPPSLPLPSSPSTQSILLLSTLFQKGFNTFSSSSSTSSSSTLSSIPYSFPTLNIEKGTTIALLFTSGTTSLGGSIKAAPFLDHHFYPSEGTCSVLPYVRLDFQPYDPTFLLSIVQSCHSGCQRAFSRGLDTLLTTDCQILKPTHIGSSPTFWTVLYQLYLAELERLTRESPDSFEQNQERAAKLTKARLGNRLLGATTGGAACSPKILTFLQDVLKIDISELYGSRETGGIARNGIVYSAVQVCLQPVPELGYEGTPAPVTRANDHSFLQNGQVYKGEICVASPRQIEGYHDLSSSAFFPYGDPPRTFYRTGDIGELTRVGDTRRLKITDRIGTLVKLNNGQWISPSKIENILEQSPFVDQAFVMGLPTEAFPIAILVPSLYFKNNPNNNLDLRQELARWCMHLGLRAFEIPSRIHLESERWSDANQMLTPTEKKKRLALSNRYASIRDALYSDDVSMLSSSSNDQSSSSSNDQSSSSSSSNDQSSFHQVLASIFPPRQLAHINQDTMFADIGGDSISASMLSSLLRAKNINIAPPDIFRFPLSHIASIWTSSHAFMYGASYAPPPVDWETELQLPSEMVTLLQENASSSPSCASPAPHVCLIGATGFLGPMLVLEILRQFPPESALYCIIRAASPEQAMARLTADLKQAQVWDAVSGSLHRIRCLNGDLTGPTLQLSAEDTYPQLVESLRGGHIIHNAARVNMMIPYEGLAKTNVAGSLNVLRLASAARATLHFISSVAAVGGYDTSERFVQLPPHQIDQKDGYGQTKVVTENHLRQAMAIDPSLDIRIYRPSTISGSSTTGYTNRLDFFASLVKIVAMVNGACISMAKSKQLHWVPVDFVAESIVAIARSDCPNARAGVFHFSNAGPNLGEIFTLLKDNFLPSLQDISPAEWKQLIGIGKNRGDISAADFDLLQNVSWGDPSGTFSKGVDTDQTFEFLTNHCQIQTQSRITQREIMISLQYLQSNNFFLIKN